MSVRPGKRPESGEHCAFDNQGFMEGGVESGEWAAQAIVEKSHARAA